MAEHWFHTPAIPHEGELVELDAQESSHATRSRHLEPGKEIVLSDGAGTTARALLKDARRRGASALVVERTLHPTPARRIHLACALPKGDRLSTLLSMATQLGMTDFTPLVARRSVVQPGAETPERWQRVVREACKQSRRPWQPVIHSPASPAESAESAGASARVLLMDRAGEPITNLLGPSPGDCLVLVGPEGGFDDEEIAELSEAGARPCALARGILRIETAAAAALAALALSE